ncbi:sensor domain-containing diguanylate cyclase [Nocardia asteroides]|uniref:GGDEF domain-containing protein n=1 Tax=Nocardia asteroides TaxID=1824 RepID=UPI001E2AA1A9|nr:GGDEF domain-containing protein [Nocardia asteroides]UGT62384.1 GGDEF domain-containing protein [Nocardia asteroides]
MNDGKTLLAWWNDPVDYAWLVGTLAARSALGPLRVLVGLAGLSIAVMGAVIAGTPIGPVNPVVTSTVGVGAGLLWALRWWLLPWPGNIESLVLIGIADVLFTVEFLQVPDRLFGAMGAVLLVVTGSYLGFFHSARALAVHTAWSLLSVIVFSVRIATGGHDVRLALAVGLLLIAAVVSVLPALQILYWLLRTESLSDPLTELLNRRGLEIRLPRLMHGYPAVCVIAFDIDRFKEVNDTWGHRVGDTVLVSTARRLHEAAGTPAVVARTGGEEFVVAVPLGAVAARAEAERLCRAVAAPRSTEVEVTASVGVAVFDTAACPDCPRPTPERLLHAADAAMYRAKQAGGNHVVVDELTLPPKHRH